MEIRALIQKWMEWKTRECGDEYQYKMLSEDSGVSTSYISNIMTGTRNAGVKTITRIAGAFGVTLAEFYAGPPEDVPPIERGETIGNDTLRVPDGVRDRYGLALSREPGREIDKLTSSLGFNASDLFLDSVSADQDNAAPDRIPSGVRLHVPSASPIPILDSVPPGVPGDWIDNADTFESVPRDAGLTGKRLFAVRMNDNSMTPVIRPNDLMYVDIDATFMPDGSLIGIINVDGRFVPRRISKRPGDILLVPANPSYSAAVVPGNTPIFKVVLFVPDIDHIF